MLHKRITVIAGFIMLALLGVVSVASAQQGPNLNPSELLGRLGPSASSAVPAYLSYLLYAIFVLSLITMLVVPDKQSTLGYLMIGVMMAALLVKVQFFYICGLATLIMNVIMLVVPLIVGGMSSSGNPGKPARSVTFGILTGILGGGHFFLFWVAIQANTAICQAVGNVDQLFGPFK